MNTVPNVVVLTPFRNSYRKEFFDSLRALDYPKLRFSFVEGDSTDDTYERILGETGIDATLAKCDLGLPYIGGIVHPIRFFTLACIFNVAVSEAIRVWGKWADYFFILPSDVTFGHSLVSTLVDLRLDYVAPMYWLGDIFYDTWGFKHQGINFKNNSKAWFKSHYPNPVYEVDYVGGPALMNAKIFYKGVRYSAEKVDHAVVEGAKMLGYKIHFTTLAEVAHI